MAFTERYLNVELVTGLNDGTSEVNAWQTWAAAAAGIAAGGRLNVKNPSSRFACAATVAFGVNGTANAPIWIRGYGSTIGDNVAAKMSTLDLSITGDFYTVEGLDMLNANTAGNPLVNLSSAAGFCVLRWCKLAADASNGNIMYTASANQLCHNCYMTVAGVTTRNVAIVAGGHFIRNIIKVTGFAAGHTGLGGIFALGITNVGRTPCYIIGNLIYVDPSLVAGANYMIGIGITTPAGGVIMHNTVDGFAAGLSHTQVDGGGATSSVLWANNLITNCRSGIRGAENAGPFLLNNACDRALMGGWPINNFLLTSDPYTARASADFSLNKVAGGGRVARTNAAAIAGSFTDIGALQATS